jgi:hypothetical protein
MAIDFYVKSDESYLRVRLWIPSTSREEKLCSAMGGEVRRAMTTS